MTSEIPRLRVLVASFCGKSVEVWGFQAVLTYGALLELTVVRRLLHEIEDLLGQSLVGLGPRSTVEMLACTRKMRINRLEKRRDLRGVSHYEGWVLVVVGEGFTAVARQKVHCYARP
jgi:hypothetical protein